MKINEELREETLSTSYLYRGKIINVRQDRVKMAEGKTGFREIVEHPGAVAVLALDTEARVVLVKQHRQPVGEVLVEIPAGKLEVNEEPEECARRELLEETGFTGDRWRLLTCFYPSPGFCDEKIYIYRAEGLRPGKAETTDEEENIAVTTVALEKARQMVLKGEIQDGKTIIALQFALLERDSDRA